MSSELNPQTPDWLRHLQENSWEAEILISGGSIFGLLSLSDAFIDFIQQLKFMVSMPGLDAFVVIVMFALKGITIGFLVHLALRGLWISLICLDYSFPNGINTARQKITNRYKKHYINFSLKEQIINIDQTSGLVFFGSMVFVIILLGYIIFLLTNTYLFMDIFSRFNIDTNIIFSIINFIYIFFLFEMMTGLIRRFELAGKIYYPFYVYISAISLATIYRPWLQTFFTNQNLKKVLIASMFFLVCTIFYSNISLVRLFQWSSIIDRRNFDYAPYNFKSVMYDSQLSSGMMVNFASIPSLNINDSYLQVFIPYRESYDEDIKVIDGKYFSDIINIGLNNNKSPIVTWVRWRHATTGQMGIVTLLPICDLPVGKNEVNISIKAEHIREKVGHTISIPFWKDVKACQ